MAHPERQRLRTVRARRPWLLTALVTLLAGCAGALLPGPAATPARFTLESGRPADGPTPPAPGAASAAASPAERPTLVIDLPRAAAGHDGTQMVYLRRAQQLEAFAFHAWVEPPAQMLAPLIVRALQDTGAFHAVLQSPTAGAGTLRLETEGLRLEQDFTTRPSQVRLTLRAVLLDTATRRVIAWRDFAAVQAAATDDPAGGVAAAGLATPRLVAELAAFCAQAASR